VFTLCGNVTVHQCRSRVCDMSLDPPANASDTSTDTDTDTSPTIVHLSTIHSIPHILSTQECEWIITESLKGNNQEEVPLW